jgi:superfamily II DNA or RNA helicase
MPRPHTCFAARHKPIARGPNDVFPPLLTSLETKTRFNLLVSRKRRPTLRFDRGSLILHPPPSSAAWIGVAEWDDRVERLRAPAWQYRRLVEAFRLEGLEFEDQARGFEALSLSGAGLLEPYPHQRSALEAWVSAGRRGVVVLPTGAGKTALALMVMHATQRSTLILVPTLDLMHQWYATLEAAFPGQAIGLLGGGSRDFTEVVVATYDSGHRVMEAHGNRWGLLIFDECHHLPGELYRLIAEQSLAPYRLGLTATLERGDGKHRDLESLVGPTVFSARPQELAGGALAPYSLVTVPVDLNAEERMAYTSALETRDAFLKARRIRLGSLEGWSRFVRSSASSSEGRRAMLAHRELKRLALATSAKIRALDDILTQHLEDRVLVFTDDNAAVYAVSRALLIPAITHQTPVKERHAILERFKNGTYPALVASKVLNEGVDVPEANTAIVLSGTGSTREHVQRLGRILRPRPGKRAVLYEVVSRDTVEEGISRRRKANSGELGDEPKPADPNRVPRLGFEPITAQDSLDFDDLGRN